MKNAQHWSPTKYEFSHNRLRGSRNTKLLTLSSRLMSDLIAARYQQNIPLYVKGHLADLGCGNVPLYAVYKDLITESTCADWPNSAHPNQYLDAACDLNQPLQFATDSFDTIILSDVLEHLSNPEMAWAEITRVARPGARILINVPFLYRVHEAPFDFYRYTEFALRNFASRNNLTVLKLEPIGGLPEVLTDLIAKSIMYVPLIGKLCANLLQRCCWFFIHTKFGKKASVKTRDAYPLGYFMVAEKPV